MPYCVLLYMQSFPIMWFSKGVVFQINHHQCASSTYSQLCQCAHHKPATGGEEREIEPIKWMGIIGGHGLGEESVEES